MGLPREQASRPTTARRHAGRLLTCLAVLLAIAGCAGYKFGVRSLYRQDIRYVHVPVFESDSLRRNLGERLTEAVIKRIESSTSYKVVGRSEADSILSGRITADTRKVQVEDPNDQPREFEVALRVQVAWVTPRGQQLANPLSTPVPQELMEFGQSSTFVPEVGQSLATAQQQAINRLAEQIVAIMQVQW